MGGRVPSQYDVSLPVDMNSERAVHGDHSSTVAVRASYVLFVLALVNFLCSANRLIPGMLLEPIKADLRLSDGQMGFITGMAYAIFNAIALLPIGVAADRFPRQKVIALCLALWSAMTALSGLANSFMQLCLCRIFVGLGEAGNSAPAMSLIADTFPPHRRGFAISIFFMASSLGMLATSLGGSLIAQDYGWRTAMMVTGAPGLGLVILLWLTVRDPRRQDIGHEAASARAGTIIEVFAVLAKDSALRHTIAGITLMNFVASAVGIWAPAFFMRAHSFSISNAGLLMAIIAAAGMVGALAGGAVCDRLTSWGCQWPAWQSAATAVLVLLSMLGFLLAAGATRAMYCYAIFGLFQTFYLGPSYSLIQLRSPPDVRSSINAFNYLMCGIFGFGLGPFVTGLISQSIAATGANALRYSLVIVSGGLAWAAFHFCRAAMLMRPASH